MDCSKGTELGGNQFIGFPAKTSVVKWDHKKERPKKKITKIATEAAEQSHRQQTPSVLWWKTQEIIAQFDSYDTVLVAYEESAKQGEKVN